VPALGGTGLRLRPVADGLWEVDESHAAGRDFGRL